MAMRTLAASIPSCAFARPGYAAGIAATPNAEYDVQDTAKARRKLSAIEEALIQWQTKTQE